MDPTAPANPDTQGKLAQLMALFGGSKAAPASPDPALAPSDTNVVKDTADASEMKGAPVGPTTGQPAENGLMGALKNLMQFFQAKPASASNDAKYQKILTDAGIPADDTGIGH